jgi:transposase InsO family protein
MRNAITAASTTTSSTAITISRHSYVDSAIPNPLPPSRSHLNSSSDRNSSRGARRERSAPIWLRDWDSADELRAAIASWLHNYLHHRPHQTLNWQTPLERLAAPVALAA